MGFKILNFNIFGGFQENDYLLGMKNFFWVIAKLDYIKGLSLCILGSFLKVEVQIGGYIFLGLVKFQIFFRGV